jgi:AcrR family transcriptional regulator
VNGDRAELPGWLEPWAPAGEARNGGGRGAVVDQRQRGGEMVARLLDAGRQALWERGYDATRVDDVVALAGVSHGTFYLYFDNKSELLHRLALDCAADLRALIHDLDGYASPMPRSDLRYWVIGLLAAHRRNGPVLRVWLERRDPDPLMRALADDVLGELAAALERRVDQRVAGALDDGFVGLALLAMLERLAAYRRLAGDGLDERALVRTEVRMLSGVLSVSDRS